MQGKAVLRRLLMAGAWVAVALLIAFGAAGIVATMDHVPGTAARAELTWPADREVEPALDTATLELEALAEQVDGLSATAREALPLLNSGDTKALEDAIAAGTTTFVAAQDQARALSEALAAVPRMGADAELYVSPELRHRYAELADAPSLTERLEADWASFTGQALDAVRLSALLARHDKEAAAAAADGTAARYQRALEGLDAADATLQQARDLAGRLGNRADTTTLTQWLDLNAAYDTALRNLYRTVLDANGAVTDAVRAAYDAETAARAQLPRDTKALVVIMSDVAQGGLNQAVISIEEARGALAAEIDVQHELQVDAALPD